MKLNKENKRGISLIVLVITIIVMIILAAAIILSLNSSGIIGKANEATAKSDAANLKEAASVKLAEYELAKQLGELEDPDQTASEYVKEKLSGEMDTSGLAITPDGEILTGLTEIAVKFVEAGVEIGAVVEGYDLTSNAITSYTTDGKENNSNEQTIERAGNIIWNYMGVDEKGEALIVAEVPAAALPQMEINSYLYGPAALDAACKALYSSEMGIARSFDIDDALRILSMNSELRMYFDTNTEPVVLNRKTTIGDLEKKLGITLTNRNTPDGSDLSNYEVDFIDFYSDDIIAGEKEKKLVIQPRDYWMASTFNKVLFEPSFVLFGVYSVMFSGNLMPIRPVVSLSSNITMTYSNGIVTLSQ